jgi:hypothetical protein
LHRWIMALSSSSSAVPLLSDPGPSPKSGTIRKFYPIREPPAACLRLLHVRREKPTTQAEAMMARNYCNPWGKRTLAQAKRLAWALPGYPLQT